MNGYFAILAVLEHGSFTKAADHLGYTQSAISQLIRSVEKELDAKLIIRSRGGVTLTPDGEQFLPYIKNICFAARELEEKKKIMQGLDNGVIRIGTFTSVACTYLPVWIKQFKVRYPHLQFELQIGDSTEIEQMILDGRVDFGFVNPVIVSNIYTVPLFQDDIFVCVSTAHPLAAKPALTLDELVTEPFILMREGMTSEALQLFEQHGLTPNIQFTVQGDYAVIALIEQGLGVTLLPELILHRFDEHIAKIALSPPKRRTISLAYTDKTALPIASRMFIEFIEATIKTKHAAKTTE